MAEQRKRSDYRTRPKDAAAYGVSFVDYLMGPHLRGYDWTPDRPPSDALNIHHQARGAGGSFVRTEGGKPKMRRRFLNWLSGEVEDVPGLKHEEVSRAIARAREADPAALAVFDWRREPSSVRKLSPVAFMDKHGIRSDSTLTKRYYKAVALIVEYACEEWRTGR